MQKEAVDQGFQPVWGPVRRSLEAALRPRWRVKAPEILLGGSLAAVAPTPELAVVGVVFFLHGFVMPQSEGFSAEGIVQRIAQVRQDPTFVEVHVTNTFSGWDIRSKVPLEAVEDVNEGDFVRLLEARPFVPRHIPAERYHQLMHHLEDGQARK